MQLRSKSLTAEAFLSYFPLCIMKIQQDEIAVRMI